MPRHDCLVARQAQSQYRMTEKGQPDDPDARRDLSA